MKFFTTLLRVLPFASLALGFANPLSCSGTCTNTHDPAIIKRSSDGTYFRFATGGSLSVHSGPKIQGPWTYKGQVLSSFSSDAWAPDVHQLPDGSYILYYSVSKFGTQDSYIGVATSKTLNAGSWTNYGQTGLKSKAGDPYNAIDANLFQEGGKNYVFFGSFWQDIFYTTASSNGRTINLSSSKPVNVQFNGTGEQAAEAAYLFKKSNYYYLFFSAGKCCGYNANALPRKGEEYSIRVCRASSPTGPFKDKAGKACTQGGGTMVLASHGWVYGPGGQGVLGGTDKGDVLYYHHVDTRVGYGDGDKRLGVNVIDWSSGWPVV